MAYYANRRPVPAVEPVRRSGRGNGYWTLSVATWMAGLALLVAAWYLA